VIEHLVNATTDRVLKVQIVAKEALQIWIRFKQSFDENDAQKNLKNDFN
jgi:hypothetical protein